MHTVALIIAGFMTLLLVGSARRGGLIRAWVLTALSLIPMAVLYVGYNGDVTNKMVLWPVFVLASVALYRAAMILKDLMVAAPVSLDNVPANGAPHWAA